MKNQPRSCVGSIVSRLTGVSIGRISSNLRGVYVGSVMSMLKGIWYMGKAAST